MYIVYKVDPLRKWSPTYSLIQSVGNIPWDDKPTSKEGPAKTGPSLGHIVQLWLLLPWSTPLTGNDHISHPKREVGEIIDSKVPLGIC